MDRKEFIKTLWLRFFKPLVVVLALFFTIRFLINVLRQPETFQFILVSAVGFIILEAAISLLALIINKLVKIIQLRLPPKTLHVLKLISKTIDILLPVALGIFIYHLWLKDEITGFLFFLTLFITKVIEIVKKQLQSNH